MNLDFVNDVFSENLRLYDRAISGIRQCLARYEQRCGEIIFEISNCNSFEDSSRLFDELLIIQGNLGLLLFGREIEIGKKLRSLTYEFDRLDDQYIREFWFNKFKEGVTWPELP